MQMEAIKLKLGLPPEAFHLDYLEIGSYAYPLIYLWLINM